MADPKRLAPLATNSYDTALCIIPPKQLWAPIDRLRSRYDDAYRKWPPHINLVYPFVQVDRLPAALEAVRSAAQNLQPFRICLGAADVFQDGNYAHERHERMSRRLQDLHKAVVEALGHEDAGDYRVHTTIGQSDGVNDYSDPPAVTKTDLLPRLEWDLDELYVLRKDHTSVDESTRDAMKAWATIRLGVGNSNILEPFVSFYNDPNTPTQILCPYLYDGGECKWKKATQDLALPQNDRESSALTVSTYDVLAECPYLSSQKRYPLLIKNILSDDAKAEILVLQEVTGDFLSQLLEDKGIQGAYPFCSHDPPGQKGIEPLPNHGNVVVLSKYAFDWQSAASKHFRQNNHSLIIKFRELGEYDKQTKTYRPLTLAAIHLAPGLQDDSIALKGAELSQVISCLDPSNPTILAGDFNIPTSSYTISHALGKKVLAPRGAAILRMVEKSLDGFLDTWTLSHIENGTSLDENVASIFEGEQGATYDPTANAVATDANARIFEMRPQRFDRVMVRGGQYSFQVLGFNKFGFIAEKSDENGKALYPSDHWGVRAALRLGRKPDDQPPSEHGNSRQHFVEARGSLADHAGVVAAMENAQVILSEKLVEERAAAFQLLKDTILERLTSTSAIEMQRPSAHMVFVPVGSYGLGTWTSSSNINCLCIGSFSKKTFVSLAGQRLKKAADKNIRIVRVLQGPKTFVLIVQGIQVDIQYVSAHALAQDWPRASKLPATDPVWVGLESTEKLAMKDYWTLEYVRRSIPSIAKFQLAHRFIKTWAERRGIYGQTYLCGIQITIMLAAVYKAWACETALLSVPDILATFFSYYADFDWGKRMVFDPFFHKGLRYRRLDREFLVILGYFSSPIGTLNTSTGRFSHVPQILAQELRRADGLLSNGGMAWSELLEDDGAADFLCSHKVYAKIDLQFWGGSLTKGRGFVHWVDSRLVFLFTDLHKRLSEYPARLWPARWIDKTEKNVENDGREGHYQCSYLIGLSAAPEDERTGGDVAVMRETLVSILGQFEKQIRSNKEHFNAQTAWIGTGIGTPADLKCLKVDSRDWAEYVLADEISDDGDGEDEQRIHQIPAMEENASTSKKKQAKPPTNQPRSVRVPKRAGAGRFRTAQDVLNRLRWDPGLDSGDFVVGYEDRFAGVMEKDLDTWKSEQTDEEFIPQHRVLYFRRKTDGVRVWERGTRTDLLFGSG